MATYLFEEVPTVNTTEDWTATDALWASGAGLWVLAGVRSPANVAGVQTSPDRTTWTMHDWPSTATRRAIAYAPGLGTVGRLVSVGNGVADWSDDGGVTWSVATLLPEANSWFDVQWWDALGIFIAVSADGVNRTMTSADGKTWTAVAAAAANAWSGLAVSDTVAVAVAFSAATGTQFIQTTPDGVTWTLQTHTAIATNRGIVAAGQRLGIGYSEDLDMFLITGTDAGNITKAYRSTDDGVTWTASQTIPTITNTTNRGYIWLETVGQWYMPCANARYGLSDDGDTWTIDTIAGVNNTGYTPLGWDGSAYLVGGSTLGFDTALIVTVADVDGISPARGTKLGGTVVTITGVGLSGVTQVTFDGEDALDVVPASDGTSLTCITPAHATGPVDVEVVGIGTLTSGYTYVSVDKVTPNHGTTFGGTAVTITGYGFDLATSVTFDGITATDIVYVSITSITCVTPKHASGSVDVVVEGVGTLEDGYTYQIPIELLPPYPYYSPLEEGGTRTISKPWADWLRVVKQRIETLPGDVPAEDVIGVLNVDNIPQLPFTRITMGSPRLLGRTSAGEGDAEEITVGPTLVLNNQTLSVAGLPNGYTIGDLLYADSATSLALLNDVSVGSYLRSGGVATAPLWSTLKLPNAATVGDLPIATSANTLTMLADVSAGSYLRSGGVGVAPLWSTLKLPNAASAGDILFATGADTYSSQSPAALTRVDDTNVTLTLGGTPATSLIKAVSITAGWNGTLAVTRGGTGLGTVAQGDLIYGSAADTLSRLAKDTNATRYLSNTGASNNPAWAEVNLTNGVTGVLPVANGGSGTGTALTQGSVVFAGASGVFSQDNANFFWDDSNDRLGIGTTSPSSPLHVQFNGPFNLRLEGTSTDVIGMVIRNASAPRTKALLLAGSGHALTAGSLYISDETGASSRQFVIAPGGNVGIGASNPTAPLEVFGNLARITNSAGQANLRISGTGSANYNGLIIETSSAEKWVIGRDGTSSTDDLIVRAGGSTDPIRIFLSGSVDNTLVAKSGNVLVGTTSGPGTGTFTAVFADGTAPSSMGSNTAGLYADDVGGTVNLFAINETGDVTRLTWGTPQTYNITNVTTDRAYDANATTIDELADTLGTLIDDLRNRGIVA